MKISLLHRGDTFISSNGTELEIFQTGGKFVQVRKPGDPPEKVFNYCGDYDPDEKTSPEEIEELGKKALAGIGKVNISEKEKPMKEIIAKVKKENPDTEKFLEELKKGGTAKDLKARMVGTKFVDNFYSGMAMLRKKGIKTTKTKEGIWIATGDLQNKKKEQEIAEQKIVEHPTMQKAIKKINKVRRKK